MYIYIAMCYGVQPYILLRMRIHYKNNACRVCEDSPTQVC